MKKFLALLLALAMCMSMAACSASEKSEPAATPKETTADAPVGTSADKPAETRTEEPTEANELPLSVLTPEQAEDCYENVMNGGLTGPIADFITTQDADTAMLYLDFFAVVFGENFLETIQGMEAREQDQLMAEAYSEVSSMLEEPEEEYNDEAEWIDPDAPATTMVLWNYDLNHKISVHLNGAHAFMEPGWAMFTDVEENYFICIDKNYNTFTLGYRTLTTSTDELVNAMMASYEKQGKPCAASEVHTFTAGGLQWEMFTLSYEQTTKGIDKDTNQEVELTSTVYDTMCFARVSSNGVLQLFTGTTSNPDIMEYYQDVLTVSISSVDTGIDPGIG